MPLYCMNIIRPAAQKVFSLRCFRSMATIIDDKSKHCLPFILKHLQTHQQHQGRASPFFVGLQGVQGAGKTTLVETLHNVLSSPPHSLSTLVLSIDDLYLNHADQVALAQSHPENPLIQHRGQPSTHDIPLGSELFDALEKRKTNIRLPSYDKSAFSGAGDRKPESDWQVLNSPDKPSVDVVIFEGWCVGFKALPQQALDELWQSARQAYAQEANGQLGKHELSSIGFVNNALKAYDVFTDRFSCFIQIDAEDPLYVYEWRLQQEAALRLAKGAGMTDEQVVHFVDGYYPAYELYTRVLQSGIFKEPGKQLRLVINKDRRVKEVLEL